MARWTSALSCCALLALVAGCSKGDDEGRRGSTNAAIEDQGDDLPEAKGNEEAPSPRPETRPSSGLIPPAPGEPGGLPDDRTPLDEGAQKNPANVAAAGLTVEQWALALEDARYGDAFRLWRGEGKASGMTEAAFAESYRKYAEIHVQIGRPVAAGQDGARVPVQVYGRMAANGAPFNIIGALTLARTPEGRRPWLITGSNLKALGTVKVAGAQKPSATIPAAYRGQWASSAAACGNRQDTGRLTITANSLVFYESEGDVTRVVSSGPQAISVSARYTGEGDSWERTNKLTLSADGQSLAMEGLKRARCS